MPEVSEENSNHEERLNLDEVKSELNNGSNHQKVYENVVEEETGGSKFFRYRTTKLRHTKLPHFKISRGLLGTLIFCILFCSLLVWFIRDFEDDLYEFHHLNNSSNSTVYVHDYHDDYAMPIQYVLAVTALIVALIVASVFVVSVVHHLRAKKQRITLKTFKTENLKDIFASHRTQHRSPLYYLNQDMLNVNGIKHYDHNVSTYTQPENPNN